LGNPKGEEDLGVDGKIMLERILGENMRKGVDWLYLAQDRDQWRAVVNTVMKLRVPQKAKNFLTS
jgi:hypothetical protein